MIRTSFYSLMILFLLLYSCTPKTADKADTANNDSIKKYLDLAGNDTLDAKLRNKYNDKAFSLVDVCPDVGVVLFGELSSRNSGQLADRWICFRSRIGFGMAVEKITRSRPPRKAKLAIRHRTRMRLGLVDFTLCPRTAHY